MTKLQTNSESGFSLIEVLVALAVLAVGSVSLLAAAQTHAVRIGDIEERTVARWVAENQLSAARLGLAADPVVTMMSREWRVSTKATDTTDDDLKRIEISVGTNGAGPSFVLTGFIDGAQITTVDRSAQ